jgi:hypothetical protein
MSEKSRSVYYGLSKKAWLLIIIFIVAAIAGIVAAIVISQGGTSSCSRPVGEMCSTDPYLRCIPTGTVEQVDISGENNALTLYPLTAEAQTHILSTDPDAKIVPEGGFIGKNSNWTTGAIDKLFTDWVGSNTDNKLFIVQQFFNTNEIMIYGGTINRLVMSYRQGKLDVLPDVQVYFVAPESVLASMDYHDSFQCGLAPGDPGNNVTVSRAVAMAGAPFEEAHKKFLA